MGFSFVSLKREQSLFAEGIIPERRVQEAASAVETDRARLRQSEKALGLAGLDAASIKRIAAGGPLQDGLVVTAKTAGTKAIQSSRKRFICLPTLLFYLSFTLRDTP